jgi:hypothetical protein
MNWLQNFTAFFRSIDHKILVRAWLPSPYIVVHSFEKGCIILAEVMEFKAQIQIF